MPIVIAFLPGFGFFEFIFDVCEIIVGILLICEFIVRIGGFY